jgi:putative toxin-antitoxin system antitoxin component (TIGR02293 family)
MARGNESGTSPKEAGEIQRAAELLGGSRVLRRRLHHRLDVHEALHHGLPGAALVHLIENVGLLTHRGLLESAVGMSLRTVQRFKVAPKRPLSKEHSGRAWKFAEILAKAAEVLGSQQEAERWLERPALGLEQRRPIDLLATPAGVKLVEELLERLEYGVYA